MKLSQSAKERQPCANDNKKVKLHSPPFVPKRNFANASWSRTGVATRKDLCTDRCKHESLSIPQLCWEVLFQSIASCCGLSLPVWKLRFSIWTILESSCRLSLMRRCQSLPVKEFFVILVTAVQCVEAHRSTIIHGTSECSNSNWDIGEFCVLCVAVNHTTNCLVDILQCLK